MPKYYTPRIQQAMQDAMRYATPRVNEGDTSFTGGREGTMGPEGRSFEGDMPDAGYMVNDVPGAVSGKPTDKVKYYNRLESNLREIGDTQGAMQVQREREEYLSAQQKATSEKEKQSAEMSEKKQKAGEEKLRFFGSIAGDIAAKADKDPEGAKKDHEASVWIARRNNIITQDEADDMLSSEFNKDEHAIMAKHYEKIYGWKERDSAIKAAKTGGGKGGTPTSFNQIVDKLRKELKISGEPLIKMAREVYSEGKYNRNAAAVSLKKGGMSEEGIRKFLDKLEGKEAAAPAKMKVSKDKVKFID